LRHLAVVHAYYSELADSLSAVALTTDSRLVPSYERAELVGAQDRARLRSARRRPGPAG
jgi:hypothetical protein